MTEDDSPPPQHHLERIVDELEAKVMGDVADQSRDEDDDEAPAFEQDLDNDPPETGAAAEPSS